VNNKFYITTTLPYVNAEPHIGFALEIVQADAIARYHKLLGEEVIFNFGTDEHGQKIYQKALDAHQDPQEYCDEYAVKFDALKKSLNLSYTNFIRTTDPKHIEAAQEFWKLCDKNGDIYKKQYKTKYCVGCELEKTDSELVDGRCPLHPNRDLEIIEEENYFFKFSKYQKPLLDFYDKNPNFVVPSGKFNEIKSFVKEGLQDFSISRLKSKMPWGIPVPGDSDQVMYVWFDALVNYISTLGWPKDTKNYEDFWPGIQVAGKDNLRQQTAIWQAMLMSAGLPNSKQVFIHGFITVDGQKISKSLGNTINPIEVAEKYGTDALRYYLLAKINPYDDSDFTFKQFEETYNGELANGLGNLVSRVAKLCEREGLTGLPKNDPVSYSLIERSLEEYRFDEALSNVWSKISIIDGLISSNEPWKITDKKDLKEKLENYVAEILSISYHLRPFLPETAEKIEKQFKGPKIKAEAPLFPRL
jgi:methionyl-tRNA synthetase